jgi:serine/threonine-protein kinase
MATAIKRPTQNTRLIAETGRTLRVESWAGEGSFARVYRAAYEANGTVCAIKLAKPEVAGAAERLRSQERVLAAVQHPRLCALWDRGEFDSGLWLALEWLNGPTLRDEIDAKRRLPLKQALDVLTGVLEGLSALHARGLAHGDIRGGNVILANRGPVLTDPLGDDLCRPPADVAAAGLLFREALTGSESGPFGGLRRNIVALAETAVAPEPPTAEKLLAQTREILGTL